MDLPEPDGVTLTAFDPRTAQAVVAVLQRAGVRAWAAATSDAEIEVLVAQGSRQEALNILRNQMEEVRRVALEHDATAPVPAVPPDPDDAHAGPPLVMERLRNLRVLAAVVMVPLLVVTLAPTIRGEVRIAVLLAAVAVGVLILLWRRRG